MRVTTQTCRRAAILLLPLFAVPAIQAAELPRAPLLSHTVKLDFDAARWRDRFAASMRPATYRNGITIALTDQLDLATGILNPGAALAPERMQFVTGVIWRF